jgi:hypothetical protein
VVVRITVRAVPPYFGRGCYDAVAGRRLVIRLRDLVFTVEGHRSVPVRLVISPRGRPAFGPVRGRPGMWAGGTRGAVLVGAGVAASGTGVFRVGALRAGRYDLQDLDGLSGAVATLVVRR